MGVSGFILGDGGLTVAIIYFLFAECTSLSHGINSNQSWSICLRTNLSMCHRSTQCTIILWLTIDGFLWEWLSWQKQDQPKWHCFFFHVYNNWHIFRIQYIFYKFIMFMSLSWSVMVGIIENLVDLWSLFPNKKCK